MKYNYEHTSYQGVPEEIVTDNILIKGCDMITL